MAGTIWSRFFWSDWLSDGGLRRCSEGARGVWMDMLCIAAQHDPPGYVATNNQPFNPTDIGRLAGISTEKAQVYLAELEKNGVFSRTRDGTIYNRRMVSDHEKRERAVEAGKKGGNPSLRSDDGKSATDKGGAKAAARTQNKGHVNGADNGSPKATDKAGVAPMARDHLPSSTSHLPSSTNDDHQTTDSAPREQNKALDLADWIFVQCGYEPKNAPTNWYGLGSTVGKWLNQGWDENLDIRPAVSQAIAQRGGNPPETPKYFEKVIANFRAERLKPLPAGEVRSPRAASGAPTSPRHEVTNPVEEARQARIEDPAGWEKVDRMWLEQIQAAQSLSVYPIDPKPNDPRCPMIPHLLVEFGWRTAAGEMATPAWAKPPPPRQLSADQQWRRLHSAVIRLCANRENPIPVPDDTEMVLADWREAGHDHAECLKAIKEVLAETDITSLAQINPVIEGVREYSTLPPASKKGGSISP